ncbi:MAG: hypothetical protein IPO81_12650 [Kouleothrix sp.]|nr:hypothetical protein [Kouleothrix sp.]
MQLTASERDRLRQQQLENLGWSYHRIWCLDWYQRREETIARILDSYAEAVRAADQRLSVIGPPAVSETVLQAKTISDLDEEEDVDVVPPRERRPDIPQGLAIGSYVPTQLVALVRWINSDGVLRTDEEIMEELRKDLGFQRLGPRMPEAFQTAINLERRNQKRH